MTDAVLALDQGTTNSKALLVDPATLRVLGAVSRPAGISSPRPGWVEQDPLVVWESIRAAAEVIAQYPTVRLAGIAIANQRESVAAWDATAGTPLGPLLSWQDQRGAALCAQLASPDSVELARQRTGLEWSPVYSASKLRWLIDHTAGHPQRRIGTVDSWLLDRLTGGREYAMEAGNAARTLLYDIGRLAWDADLAALFGVPLPLLPEVRGSAGPWGVTRGVAGIPDRVPILAVLGDSHAAWYGHRALDRGYRWTTSRPNWSNMISGPSVSPTGKHGRVATSSPAVFTAFHSASACDRQFYGRALTPPAARQARTVGTAIVFSLTFICGRCQISFCHASVLVSIVATPTIKRGFCD